MSNVAIANTVGLLGTVLIALGFYAVVVRERYRSRRRPGQRWDRYLGKWVD